MSASTARCHLVRMRRSGGEIVQDADVYIGRDQNQGGWSLAKSKWANPFKVGAGSDRAKVVRQYEEYLRASPELMAALPELKGKSLGCWCAPEACHGDVLVRLVNELEDKDNGSAAEPAAAAAAASSSSGSSAAAAAAKPASSSSPAKVFSIFSPVKSPVKGRKRSASPPPPAAPEDDEEQKSQEDEEDEAAQALKEEALAEAQPGPKGRAARASKKQKLEETKPTIPDQPTASSTMDDDEAEDDDDDEPAAAASSSSAAAAASSSVAAAPGRASPSVLSFPAATLSKGVPSYGAAFDAIARDFLLNYELIANGVAFRVLEIEFYYRSADSAQHVDLFAHAHPVQYNNFGYWHRMGTKPDSSYKGGNYKGLDVTVGPVGGGGHGGILIRAVQRVKDGAIIEGSCLVAQAVLEAHGGKSIAEVVASWKGNTSAFSNPTLYFAPAKNKLTPPKTPNAPLIVRSPRVGLTLKQAGESRPQFIMLPYRYCRVDVPGFVNKKMKQTILLSAYEELGSASKATLRTICGCTAAYVDLHVNAYESGKKLGTMAKFVKDSKTALNGEGMSQMYGAWMAQFGASTSVGGKHVAFLRAPTAK